MDIKEEFTESLAHFGVPGMKWGKSKSRSRAEGYTDQQVKRDKQVYGARGSRRINKNLKKGDQISVARGAEKTRRDRVISKNKYVRQGGKVAGSIGGIAVANIAISGINKLANSSTGGKIASRFLGASPEAIRLGQTTIRTLSSNPVVRIAASTAAAKAGNMLAGDLAVSANMRANGYDPTRKY
jgi:hypothetical protein